MEPGFLTVLESAITEMGLRILDDHKRAKAIILDYAHGEFRNEINFLLLILEKKLFCKNKWIYGHCGKENYNNNNICNFFGKIYAS
jgi:hypothetical protein